MVGFRTSKTAHNLLLSYSAEAQARTRYNFFAEQAKSEDLIHIARIFDETAEQEYAHGLRFFKFFNGGEREITGIFPSGVIKDTVANLIAAADLERFVHDTMYKVFAEVAAEEGFLRAAETFTAINVAEKHHELLFRKLADDLISGHAFKRSEKVIWRCLNCGYLHEDTSPPDTCPACVKPPGYFAVLCKD
jgi:rubrerythrin